MTFFDEARSIEQMMEVRNMTQAKLAEVLGVSQPYIANKIRLLNFSQNEQKHSTSCIAKARSLRKNKNRAIYTKQHGAQTPAPRVMYMTINPYLIITFLPPTI